MLPVELIQPFPVLVLVPALLVVVRLPLLVFSVDIVLVAVGGLPGAAAATLAADNVSALLLVLLFLILVAGRLLSLL